MMTEYQRTLVEENLDLLDRLILKHIGVSGRALQTYEDYYQIGSEALCRAAMQYDPTRGPFAPLGWRYAYNAIIDHCRKQQQVNQSISIVTDEDGENDFLFDMHPVFDEVDDKLYGDEINAAMAACKNKYSGVILKGIVALELKALGYSSREIAEQHGSTVNNVNAWIARARSVLKTDPLIQPFLQA